MAAKRTKTSAEVQRGELALIDEIRRRAVRTTKAAGLRLGIGDDCALLALRRGEELAVTTDLSIAGRHFLLDVHPASAVGHRTLARGLSDLAAMGAQPVAAFLSLGLPRELTVRSGKRAAWVDGFLDGLMALAAEWDVPLAGGDLAQSPVAVADIVLTGAVPRRRALLRSGAKPGDALYVTGRLGGAAAGLEKLKELAAMRRPSKRLLRGLKEEAAVLQPHLFPEPRIAQGLWLQKRRVATAAIDISDGLSTDVRHLCEESGVAAEIEGELIPVAEGANLAQALHGGEDYELLFTAKAGWKMPKQIAGVAVTRIGRMVRRDARRPQVRIVVDGRAEELEARGWEHFS